MRTSFVVLNTNAGTMGPEEESKIRRAFADGGSEVTVVLVPPEDVEKAVRDALGRNPDVVFVGGGDGTLATAARCLLGSETSLGVLPLGTRNHFARDLGIPLEIEAAVKSLLAGVLVEVDVGKLNGIPFINNASIGVYPEAVASREWHQHRIGMSKAAAWILAIVNVFWRYPMQVLRIQWEGRGTIARTPFVLISNNQYVIAAEGFGRRVSLREGELGAYYAPRVGRFRFLWNATKALFGLLRTGPDLEKIVASRVTVETRKRKVDVAVDGEIRSVRPPLEFEVVPRILRVVVPRPAA